MKITILAPCKYDKPSGARLHLDAGVVDFENEALCQALIDAGLAGPYPMPEPEPAPAPESEPLPELAAEPLEGV